jgi:hypothetical protein
MCNELPFCLRYCVDPTTLCFTEDMDPELLQGLARHRRVRVLLMQHGVTDTSLEHLIMLPNIREF